MMRLHGFGTLILALAAGATAAALTLSPRPAAALPPLEATPPPLVLSEVMVNPSGDDVAGEWVEVFNLGAEPAALSGVWLEVGGVGALAVPADVTAAVPGRSYLVLGRQPEWLPLWSAEGAGAAVDVPLDGDALLPNEYATLRLRWAEDAVLDEVTWGAPDAGALPAGAALNREPAWETGAPLETAEWCAATQPPGEGGGDRGTPGAANTWCDSDGDGFAEDTGDCDDANAAVAPDGLEVCNGVDDDCDGATDDVAPPPTIACLGGGVCAGAAPQCAGAEGWVCPYHDAWQAEETLCDSLDNDCDGVTDEGLRNACGRCGAVLEDACNGVDDDCDGETDEDAAADPLAGGGCPTTGVCAGAQRRCAGLDGWVCAWPADYEADEERSCDGLDNDCDGATDEPFDLAGVCVVGSGACAATGTPACAPDGRGVVCDAVPGAAGQERCGNGFDDDCDGETDEGFDVGVECVVGSGACRTRGKYVCSADLLGTVCSAALPEGEERCANGRDDDCDGETDELECDPVDGAPAVAPVGCAAAAAPAPGGAGAFLALLLLLLAATIAPRRRIQ